MSDNTSARLPAAGGRRILIPLALLALLAIVLLLGVVTLRGRGLGLWRYRDMARAVLDSRNVTAGSGDFANIIFLHHSVGYNLIEQGRLREAFAAAGLRLWDHDYDAQGLRRPDGHMAGYSYAVPNDNTDPDGLAAIFAQKPYPLPLNTFSGLLQHDVIIVKSCFPASNITSDSLLEKFKNYYLGMRAVMDQHPDKLFIVLTTPPLNPAETDVEAAGRARAFAEWLTSPAYLDGHPNVAAFDLFGSLAEPDPTSPKHNMLRAAYQDGADSHPNRLANETVGPLFVQTVVDAITRYRQTAH